MKPHPQVPGNPFQLQQEREPGCLAQHHEGWADLPDQPSPGSGLANSLSPTRVPDPLISALKPGRSVSPGPCWSLTEKEGASEALAVSFGGPNVVEEVALRNMKEGFGDSHSSRGLLDYVLQLSCPIDRNGRHRNAPHQHHGCSSSHGFPQCCLTWSPLTSPKSCSLTLAPSELDPTHLGKVEEPTVWTFSWG